MTLDELNKLSYRNEEKIEEMRPVKKHLKEVPFLKNNPRKAQMDKENEAAGKDGGAPAQAMTEK